VRTPMQWSPDRNAGFSDANPQQLYLPVILDPAYHYEAVNVEMQRRNTSSLFWFMKRMINMRKNFKAFSRGNMKFMQAENPKIISFIRSYRDEKILVICNLSKYAQPAEIDLREFKGYVPVEIFSKNQFPTVKDDNPYFFTLSSHSFQWFILQKPKHAREEAKQIPRIELSDWSRLLETESKSELEKNVLLPYILKRKWYKGKGRKPDILTIERAVPLHLSTTAYILLLEISFESGLPETYQLAITNISGEQSEKVKLSCPEAIIAQASVDGQDYFLCDAFYVQEFQVQLFQQFAKKARLEINDDVLEFTSKEEVSSYFNEHQHPVPKMHNGDENNTSITYDNRFFLKMYRKVEKGVNPDTEISYYLSEEAKFNHTPAFLGTMELNCDEDKITLGMMQVMIENHGDGRMYMLERLNNYIERILARNRDSLDVHDKRGTLTEPVGMDELPEELQVLLGNRVAEQVRLIGSRTADLHLTLAQGNSRALKPEEYSLHYQRSLFSSMQALVRESYQSFDKKFNDFPEPIKKEAVLIKDKKNDLLTVARRIYAKKLDIWKSRTHGSYTLRKLLMTGKDIVIQDFSANPTRSFSTRRLKRSPLRDVAEMIISFHYTAYEGFFINNHVQREDVASLLPFAELWAHYMSGIFIKAYLEKVKGSSLIPHDKTDLEVVLHTFLLEKSLVHFNSELNNRPEWSIVPLRIIKSILGIKEMQEEVQAS
jgi:maltose alpha-D-glucosyltransferase/alpha-amylase